MNLRTPCPESPEGKGCKLCNLNVLYRQDLSLRKGRILYPGCEHHMCIQETGTSWECVKREALNRYGWRRSRYSCVGLRRLGAM